MMGQGFNGGAGAGSGNAVNRRGGGGGGATAAGTAGVSGGAHGVGGAGVATTWVDGTTKNIGGGSGVGSNAVGGGTANYGGGGYSLYQASSPEAGGPGLVVVRFRLPRVEISATLEDSIDLDTPAQITEPKVNIAATTSDEIVTTVNAKVVRKSWYKPQRELVWVHDFNDERVMVID